MSAKRAATSRHACFHLGTRGTAKASTTGARRDRGLRQRRVHFGGGKLGDNTQTRARQIGAAERAECLHSVETPAFRF